MQCHCMLQSLCRIFYVHSLLRIPVALSEKLHFRLCPSLGSLP